MMRNGCDKIGKVPIDIVESAYTKLAKSKPRTPLLTMGHKCTTAISMLMISDQCFWFSSKNWTTYFKHEVRENSDVTHFYMVHNYKVCNINRQANFWSI